MLNRDIGFMVRRLNFGGERGGFGGPVMEEGVGLDTLRDSTPAGTACGTGS
jgi:hypothetical protein